MTNPEADKAGPGAGGAGPQCGSITVEVAYARPDRQVIIPLQVEAGCTALQAVIRSNITRQFTEIDPLRAHMGIFSQPLDGRILPLPGEYRLEERDRVEIYRPLLLDPKQARLLRAQKARQKQAGSGPGQ